MSKYDDLLVINGEFVFDSEDVPLPISDQASIGQDIKHRLIESGLVLKLIAERSTSERSVLLNEVLIEVDKDTRLIPGTAKIVETAVAGTYTLTAQTLDYSQVEVTL